MKITTWNVNGLRSSIKKEFMDWMYSNSADILCLQEIKVRPDQLPLSCLSQFNRYFVYWNPAERPGYSGVATISKKEPSDIKMVMDNNLNNKEGRLIVSYHPGFKLYNVYFPNGRRDKTRLSYKLNFYTELLTMCKEDLNQGEKVIICGDFNTAHKDIDLRNPKQNRTISGFLPEERALIDEYLSAGFIDVYRFLYPDKIQYTWWTYRYQARERNIGWRLDYFLLSESLLTAVKEVNIRDDILGSDHCPVDLILDEKTLICL